MKGQVSYIMKPMMLIGIIILLLFLIQTLYSGRGRERMAEKKLDTVSTATNILLILANSKQCLAYHSSITDKTQGIVLNVTKLDIFQNNYQEIEPECARNYEFGWKVQVSQMGRPVGGSSNVERAWTFGARDFSKDSSLNNEVRFWIPVGIKYPKGDARCGANNRDGCVKLGKMDILLVDGELEKLAGFFDWSCMMGRLGRMTSTSTEVSVSQKVTYDSASNRLCVGSSCRRLQCPLLYFDGFNSKGTYSLKLNYQSGNLVVG
ncbi:MAG: hypothetical protein QXY45_00975 [Candidatus Aenigmatarchaeota archaeon]